ncbi:MAG: FAD-binding protein [Candidatus Lokiarchaeota archaeon]|nr:FAD-binding protein [Candidatus Lokiarchaeota archaeon]
MNCNFMNDYKDYDVIVVGAGPGGATAGKFAAEAGLKTIILERGRTPGEKNNSGSALSTKCFRDFPYLKKEFDTGRIAKTAVSHFINENFEEEVFFGFSASKRLGRYKEAKEFLTLNVYRSEFDPYLCNLAVEAGAELKTSTLIKDLIWDKYNRIIGVVDENNKKFKGIVIAADGVNSIIARKSGLRHKWAQSELTLMLTIEYKADEKKIDEVFGSNALHYWFSPAFPVGYSFFHRSGIHVGLGHFVNAFDKNPLSYVRQFLKVNSLQRQINLVDGIRREFQAHLLTFVKKPKRTWTNNLMLVGDAAGFPCPIEAEGIYYAMISGKIAANIAIKALSTNNFLGFDEYEHAWKNSPIGEEFEAAPEIYEFIRAGPFSMDTCKWVVPLLNDLLYSIFNVADSHLYNLKKIIPRLLRYPQMLSFILNYISPAIVPITESYIKEKINQILPKYFPDILNSLNRRLESIKSIREKITELVYSFIKK